jgi:hypothetical protein
MLHEFLIGKRSELIERCKRKVAQRRAPETIDATLEHGIPHFAWKPEITPQERICAVARSSTSTQAGGDAAGQVRSATAPRTTTMICIHLLPETKIKAAATAPMLARGIGFSEALMDRTFGDLNGKQLEDQKDTAAWPPASYTQSFQPSTQAGTQQDWAGVVLAHRRTAGPRYGPARTDQTGEEQKARFRTVWQPRRMNR